MSWILAMTLAAAPTLVQIDLQDALRLPNGVESPASQPLIIFVRAPASWVHGKALTETAKTTVLAKLYGGPNWMKGNSDGSTFVVKSFASKVITATPEGAKAIWYDVKPDGTLEKLGPNFGEAPAPKPPSSFIDHAEKGSVFKTGPKISDGKALLTWLNGHSGLIQLPVVLTAGSLGFNNRDAKVGSLKIVCDDAPLGISLADRARSMCEGQKTCELWLTGTWKGGAEHVFTVSKVERVVGSVDRELKMNDYVMVQEG